LVEGIGQLAIATVVQAKELPGKVIERALAVRLFANQGVGIKPDQR
jgi:hypothetical protein